MNDTWYVARALIEAAKRPEDIRRFLAVIRDRHLRSELIRMLAEFTRPSDLKPEVSELRDPSHQVGRDLARDARLLQVLFRNKLGFTNLQVEMWLSRNFHVTESVGKDALLSYIQRVLRRRGSSFSRELLAKLQIEAARRGPLRPEIQEFADRLEKRNSGE